MGQAYVQSLLQLIERANPTVRFPHLEGRSQRLLSPSMRVQLRASPPAPGGLNRPASYPATRGDQAHALSLAVKGGKVRLSLQLIKGANERLLPESQCRFRPGRSAVDIMFVVRRLQELGRKEGVPLYTCFVDLQKAYDSVDRYLLWDVLARFGVPPVIVDIDHQFHDGMRACVRLDVERVSKWLEVGQGLHQGCVLTPILFNIFFTAVLNTAKERVQADPRLKPIL